jgi:alkanesulfonate monooxygenase SsuD/methylene tetrahydromethanopterin reductase-like flavin-dependent oxidoreductase (luciferase family)
MRFAVDIPNFGDYADPHLVAEVARDAEQAGWDAIWVWDHIMRSPADPLDHLSGGRLVLGVGSGSRTHEFASFGDPSDLRTRAEMLDEGLAVIQGLWTGRPFSYEGRHFQVRDATFLPEPVQQPRIPVWVAATWPVRAPLRRAARWDGVWPLKRDEAGNSVAMTPGDLRGVAATIREERAAADREGPFEILVAGVTPTADPAAAIAIVREFADAGATWWTERINRERGSLEEQRARIRQGPPKP